MPENWSGTERLLQKVENEITNAENRPAYYPGSEDRQNAARKHANAKCLGSKVDRTIIYGADSQMDEPCFKNEYFSPVLATVSIPGDNPSSFIRAAVQFANEKLDGTLGANIIIDQIINSFYFFIHIKRISLSCSSKYCKTIKTLQ